MRTHVDLPKCGVDDLDAGVAAEAILVRRDFPQMLPDAIVFAVTRVAGCLRVTRGRNECPGDDPGTRCP